MFCLEILFFPEISISFIEYVYYIHGYLLNSYKYTYFIIMIKQAHFPKVLLILIDISDYQHTIF